MLPAAAAQLVKRGHRVLVETGAGLGVGMPDEAYQQAGAEIIADHAGVFAAAEMIVKVKEPLPEEYPLLRRGQILFTYLHLAASRPLTEALAASGATGIAYETVEVNGRLPLLEPMSEIAGRMSHHGRRVFPGKTQGRQGRAARRRARRAAGQGGGHRRRHRGVNAARMATGLGRGRDHPGSGSGADAFPGHHDAAPRTRSTPARPASRNCCPRVDLLDRRGAGARRQGAEADHAARCCA